MHGSITGRRKIYPQVPNMKVKGEGEKNERLYFEIRLYITGRSEFYGAWTV